MLLFNAKFNRKRMEDKQFKNILCYCSTVLDINIIPNPNKFKNILCYCSTISLPCELMYFIIFKNILCYCSTERFMMSTPEGRNLKTSYVIVQPRLVPCLVICREFKNILCYCSTMWHRWA